MMDDFREGLRELGYVEGQNIALEFRSAEGKPERHPELAAELVAVRPDVIVTAQGQAAVALANATTVIPIVIININPSLVGITDPSRPGGNITGLGGSVDGDVTAKRLQLLKQSVPGVTRVATLWNSAAATGDGLPALQRIAPQLGLQIHPYLVRNIDEIDGALRTAVGDGTDALLNQIQVLALPRRSQIAEFALQHRLPSMHPIREYVEAGGLLSYGRKKGLWRRAAPYVDRILRGAKPADLPVEDPSSSAELVINLCTAASLGLAIPPTVLPFVSEAISCGR